MLIKTPETEDAFLAKAKKSDNCIKFPSFLAFGFRYNEKFAYGLSIAAAVKTKIYYYSFNNYFQIQLTSLE